MFTPKCSNSAFSIPWTCFISRVSKQEALSWLRRRRRVSLSCAIRTTWIRSNWSLFSRSAVHFAPEEGEFHINRGLPPTQDHPSALGIWMDPNHARPNIMIIKNELWFPFLCWPSTILDCIWHKLCTFPCHNYVPCSQDAEQTILGMPRPQLGISCSHEAASIQLAPLIVTRSAFAFLTTTACQGFWSTKTWKYWDVLLSYCENMPIFQAWHKMNISFLERCTSTSNQVVWKTPILAYCCDSKLRNGRNLHLCIACMNSLIVIISEIIGLVITKVAKPDVLPLNFILSKIRYLGISRPFVFRRCNQRQWNMRTAALL